MPDQQGTLNNDGADSSMAQTSSEDLVDTVDRIPTMLDTDPEAANNTGGTQDSDGKGKEADDTKSDTDTTDKDKQADGGGEEDLKGKPFHEHPRFQEITKERDEARAELQEMKGRLAVLETYASRGGGGSDATGQDQSGGQQADYEDLTKLSKDEVLDRLSEDPLSVLANFARQVRHEVRADVLKEVEEANATQSVEKTYQSYSEANPDFQAMLRSGEIDRYIANNPGHNPISAHMALTEEKRIADAVEKAKKEADTDAEKAAKEKAAAEKKVAEEAAKQAKAKQDAKTLSGGPARGGGSGDIAPELKDPKAFGGATAVITQRLQARRKAGGL
jgi:hypothetical protein